MIDNIEKQILYHMIRSADYISSKDLSFSLNTSEKTVLKYLNLLKADLKDNGASLEVKHGYGSRLQITDQEKFNSYLADIGNSSIPSGKEERKIYVLFRLLNTDDYINIYDLADELYVSPSLLRLIIKDLIPTTEKYNLELKHSHSHGYRITGSESDVRRCLSKECAGMNSLDDFAMVKNSGKDLHGQISSIITRTLEQYKIAVSYDAINSLTLHILIAINRNETRNFVEVDQYTINRILSSPEYYVIHSINKQMKEKLGIDLPEIEMVYLTLHLNGKQRLQGHEHLQFKIENDALVFFNRFLRNIYQTIGYDFFEDGELRVSLLNHIVPFLNRLNQNNLITKSSLEGIKNEFPYAYEMAVAGLSFLNDEGFEITPEEIGYFALHLALSMEKNKTADESFDIAIIASEISSLYNITTYKIEKALKGHIFSIKYLNIAEAAELDEEAAASYDLILNMTSELFTLSNVMNVSSFLNENELDGIRNYLRKSGSFDSALSVFREDLYLELSSANGRNDIIDQLVGKVDSVFVLPDKYRENILDRERIESTEYGDCIAIPHPLKNFCREEFVAVARLEKPVLWKNQKVQIVFLINLTTHEKIDWFMNKVSTLLGNKTLCRDLIQTKGFEEFIEKFEESA